MSVRRTGINSLSYLGVEARQPSDYVTSNRAPTSNDYQNFNIGTFWLDTDAQVLYGLVNKDAQVATWANFGGGSGAVSFTTDSGVATTSGNNINMLGGSNIGTTGASDNVTITLDPNIIVTTVTATGDITSSAGDINATAGDIVVVAGSFIDTGLTQGVVQTTGAGVFFSDNGTNGQVLIGGGTEPKWAPIISSDTSLTITNGANSIDITGGGITWVNVTGTSDSMAAKRGYITNNAGLVTLTLPATCTIGDVIRVAGNGAGGFTIAQNAGQTINFGNQSTTTGVGGSLASTNRYDAVEMLCTVTNTGFTVLSSLGNITIV